MMLFIVIYYNSTTSVLVNITLPTLNLDRNIFDDMNIVCNIMGLLM